MAGAPVQVTVYRWAGAWGPFRIRVPCGECFLTEKVIEDVLANELDGIPVALAVHDWLSGWWKPLPRGGWHAPIVVVDGRITSQGQALNRGPVCGGGNHCSCSCNAAARLARFWP